MTLILFDSLIKILKTTYGIYDNRTIMDNLLIQPSSIIISNATDCNPRTSSQKYTVAYRIIDRVVRGIMPNINEDIEETIQSYFYSNRECFGAHRTQLQL